MALALQPRQSADSPGTLDQLTDVEQVLRPAIERSRFAAESLQLLAEAAQRAGSEDGLEAVVDSAQELQLQLGEIALVGSGRAVDALNALGLEAEKLKEMEPEAAFRAVVDAIQDIPNVADRAIAAEEIFGGASEKLAGIINLTSAEFAALEEEVKKTSDIWSGDALASAKEFDQEVENLKTELGRGANALVVELLPALTSIVTFIREFGLPAFQDIKAKALEPLTDFIKANVIPRFQELATNLQPLFEEALPRIEEAFDNLTNNVFPRIKGAYESELGWILPGGALIKGAQAVVENFDALQGFFQDNVVPVLAAGSQTVVDRFGDVSNFVRDTLLPGIENAVPGFQTFVSEAFGTVVDSIKENVLPHLRTLWEFFRDNIAPILVDTLIPAFIDFKTKGLEKVAWFVENVVTPAFKALKEFWTDTLEPVIRDTLIPAIKDVADNILPLIEGVIEDTVLPAFEKLVAFFEKTVPEAIKFLTDKVEEFGEFFKGFSVDTGASSFQLSEDMVKSFEDIRAFVNDDLAPAFKEIAEFVWPLIVEVWEDTLKPTFEELVEFFEQVINPAVIAMKDDFIAAWRLIDEVVIGIVKGIILFLETQLEFLGGVIRLAMNLIAGDWEGAWQSIKDIFEAFTELGIGIWDLFGVDMQNVQSAFLSAISSKWDSIWGSISSGFGTFISPIIGWIDGVSAAIGRLITALGNIKLPELKFPKLPTFPGFAEGVRDFAGGLAVVGERGAGAAELAAGDGRDPAGGHGRRRTHGYGGHGRHDLQPHHQRRYQRRRGVLPQGERGAKRVRAAGQLMASVTIALLDAWFTDLNVVQVQYLVPNGSRVSLAAVAPPGETRLFGRFRLPKTLNQPVDIAIASDQTETVGSSGDDLTTIWEDEGSVIPHRFGRD